MSVSSFQSCLHIGQALFTVNLVGPHGNLRDFVSGVSDKLSNLVEGFESGFHLMYYTSLGVSDLKIGRVPFHA